MNGYVSTSRSYGPGSANETLGFGAIWVLSEDHHTWRVQGLQKAAELVGLQLTIPTSRHRSDEEVLAHLQGDELGEGQELDTIRATLNYISLLEDFVGTGDETALFLEDDADFGVDIRAQMKLLSQSMTKDRRLERNTNRAADEQQVQVQANSNIATDNSSSEDAMDLHNPYAMDTWDIFWLGHWGMEFAGNYRLVDYTDQYALPWSHLTSDWNNFYASQAAAQTGIEQHQVVVHGTAPLSSYAWAITRSHAEKLVRRLRNERAQTFDLALHMDCKGGVHRCVAPVPEVMHHHKVAGQKSIGYVGNVDDGQHDLDWWRRVHKYTFNIQWSARCNAAGGGEKLGDRWQCLPGKYDKLI